MVVSRRGTETELKQAQDIACAMTDALPRGIAWDMVVGSTGLFLQAIFCRGIKAEYRLEAFDEFAAHCRKQIERESRS